MVKRKNKSKKILIGIGVVILVVAMFFVISNVSQSFFSVSEVSVGVDGKVYWLLTASANKIDEGYVFSYSPEDYTKSDGTEVLPQESLTIAITKEDSGCEYGVEKKEEKILFGLRTFEYYILKNPERFANIKITDGNGNSQVLDATLIDSATIKDDDGEGEITIETQGILAGKVDCPDYENVAIVEGDGSFGVLERRDLESWLDGVSFFPSLTDLLQDVDQNTQFISSFQNPPSFDRTKLVGELNIGNGVFTITADQDYFDSVVLIPEKEVIPKIQDIIIPSKIQQDEDSTMKVLVSNLEDTSGTIIVSVESDDASIIPSSTNVQITDEKEIVYTMKTSDNVGNSEVCVEACSISQFGSSVCDSECKSFEITKEEPKEICGDNICQEFESETTCPEDCLEDDSNEDDDLICSFYQTYKEKERCGIGCSIGLKEPTIIKKCSLSTWVYFVSGIVLLSLFIGIKLGLRKLKK